MDDTEFSRLLKEAIQVPEVRRLIGNIAKESVDPDIVLLAIPYVKNITGELLLFLIGEQPRELPESDHFQRSQPKPLLKKLSGELGRPEVELGNLFDRCIVGRNQLTHCKDRAELETRIVSALELFDRHPRLMEIRKDQHYVIRHYLILLQLSLGSNVKAGLCVVCGGTGQFPSRGVKCVFCGGLGKSPQSGDLDEGKKAPSKEAAAEGKPIKVVSFRPPSISSGRRSFCLSVGGACPPANRSLGHRAVCPSVRQAPLRLVGRQPVSRLWWVFTIAQFFLVTVH